MGGADARTARHGDGVREKRAGGAHGEDWGVHKVDGTKRKQSGGDDADKKGSRDFGDARRWARAVIVRPEDEQDAGLKAPALDGRSETQAQTQATAGPSRHPQEARLGSLRRAQDKRDDNV